MKLHNLISVGTKTATRRRGRGQGSGLGGTSGRGHKGGNARSGYSPAPCCSGIPYYRRLPKRGFNNSVFSVKFTTVNVSDIARIAELHNEITRDVLVETGVIHGNEGLIKILGNGEISKPVTVIADAFSKGAIEKIQAAGGSVVNLLVAE